MCHLCCNDARGPHCRTVDISLGVELCDSVAHRTGAPLASALNVQAGVDTPNLVIAKVGDGGKVSMYNNAGTVDLVADVAGWYPAQSGLNSLTPTRLLDTRDGTGGSAGKIRQCGKIDLQVAGRGGVPTTGAGVVILNITATGGTASSYITAWPSDQPRPESSVLNVQPGVDRPNLVVAKLSADGKVSLYNNNGAVDLCSRSAKFPRCAHRNSPPVRRGQCSGWRVPVVVRRSVSLRA